MANSENSDVRIIGGGAVGIVCALTTRRYYPDKSVVLIKSVENGVVPCGIPYIAASLKKTQDNAPGSTVLVNNGVKVISAETITIDPVLKLVRFSDGCERGYKKLVLASAGLTETAARKEGFDKHPSSMPGTSRLKMKLVFSRHSGRLMGGQVSGGISCGELINIIGVAVQTGMSVSEMETLQVATHPWLTAAPTAYPIVAGALDASVELFKSIKEDR